MKQTVRFCTFETNSSSTHSCVVCSDEEYKKWQAGEILYNSWHFGSESEFATLDELEEKFNSDSHKDEDISFEDWLYDEGYKTLEQFNNSEYLESDETVKEVNGVKIHIICKYGYDG